MQIKEAYYITPSGNKSLFLMSKGKKTTSNITAIEYLEKRCIENGSTLEGRMDAFCSLLNVHQKPCVLISEITEEMWMPTLGISNPECSWICFNAILKVKGIDDQTTSILFEDGTTIEINCNRRVIIKQMNRCKEFLDCLHKDKDTYQESRKAMKTLKNRK